MLVVRDSTISESQYRGIYAYAGSPVVTVTNSVIGDNGHCGIEVSNAVVSIQDSTIQNNGNVGMRAQNSTVTVVGSSITSNANFGVQNVSTTPIVQAVDNWWGHPSGPYHPVTNPDGLGNAVSDYVAYDPWRVSPGTRESVPLVLGQTVTDCVGLLGYKDYHLVITGGLSLVAEVVPLTGSETLWLYSRLGDLPLWTRYDMRAQEETSRGTYELMVSPTQDGTYYFSVYGRNVSGTGGNYRIVVNTVERYLSDVSPRSAGNAGEVTLNLFGLPFVENMGVELRRAGSPSLAADSVTLASPTALWAHFDLSGAAAGVYDVVVLWPGGGEASLTGALTVTPGIGPRLEARLVAPEAVRPGRQYVLWLEYANTGDADLLLPVFLVTGSSNAKIRLEPGTFKWSDSVRVAGLSSEGPAGILPPGSSNRVSIVSTLDATGNSAEFELRSLTGVGEAIEWATIEAEILSQFGDAKPGWWDAFWLDFQAVMGSTWRDWQQELSDLSTELSSDAPYDADQLVRYRVAEYLLGTCQLENAEAPSAEMLDSALTVGWVGEDDLRRRAEATRYYTYESGSLREITLPKDGGLFEGDDVLIVGYGWNHGDWGEPFVESALASVAYKNHAMLIVAPDVAFGNSTNTVPLIEATRARGYVAEVAGDAIAGFGVDPRRADIYAHSMFHQVGSFLLDRWQREGHPATLFVSMDGFLENHPIPDVQTDIVTIETLVGITVQIGDWHLEVAGQGHNVYSWVQSNLDLIEQLRNQYPNGGWFQVDRDGNVYVREEAPLDYLFWTGEPYRWAPTDLRAREATQIIRPRDPNEKTGPAGTGQDRVVTSSDELHYTIYFENVPTATAPAQQVVIVDNLDPDLDWNTFQVTEIAFGDRVIAVQDDADQFYTQETIMDYRDEVEKSWWVDVTAQLNYQTGQVNWTLRTLDPETGELLEDPLAGFLPPNDGTGRGEGHVAFSVKPRSGLARGTVITNQASIVFDTETSIVTNEVWNTVGAPSFSVYLPVVLRKYP